MLSKYFTEMDWAGVCGVYHCFRGFLVAFSGQRFQEKEHFHFSCPLQKRHLKSEFAMLQTLSRLFHLLQFVKSWQIVLELNSKGLYQSSGKEKQSCCVVFPASTKRQIRYFHIVVVQGRQRNVQKSVMHVQLNLNPVGLNHLWLKLIGCPKR